MRCEQCMWSGNIETESEADTSRHGVETGECEFCPVCGEWGLVQ